MNYYHSIIFHNKFIGKFLSKTLKNSENSLQTNILVHLCNTCDYIRHNHQNVICRFEKCNLYKKGI